MTAMATHDRWLTSWQLLGGEPPTGVLDALLARFSEPQRAYHTLTHVGECFDQLDRSSMRPVHAGEVELALWFHDAIYDSRAMDNEERSAAWAHEALATSSVPNESAGRVSELILATKHDADARTGDQALVVDVDLSILGESDGRFDEYERQIRREYAWVPEAEFRTTRAEILRAFLQRPELYSTPDFKQRLESVARANLARSLEMLTS